MRARAADRDRGDIQSNTGQAHEPQDAQQRPEVGWDRQQRQAKRTEQHPQQAEDQQEQLSTMAIPLTRQTLKPRAAKSLLVN